jgi:hypothetical protein
MERDRSPEGRFIYLAEKRVAKAKKAIQSVSKLSDRKNYSYSEAQVQQIVGALEGELESMMDDFKRNSRERTSKFEFK